ncbi:hypothetical protein FOCC_FOCC011319, partial [Frankliniella occidentalis]
MTTTFFSSCVAESRPRVQADHAPVRGGRGRLASLHRRGGHLDVHGAVDVRQRGLQGVEVPRDDGAARLLVRRRADRAEPLGGRQPPAGLAATQVLCVRPRPGRGALRFAALRAPRVGGGRLPQHTSADDVQRAARPVLRGVLPVRDVRHGQHPGARVQHRQLHGAVRHPAAGPHHLLPVHLLHAVQRPEGDPERGQDQHRDARPEPAAQHEASHGQVALDRRGHRVRLPRVLAAVLHHHARALPVALAAGR